MPRKIRLTYTQTGESVTAEMLDKEAPQLCQMIWEMLPIEHKAIHGMYSGAEVFLLLDKPQPAPNENLVQIPLPGELLYFYDNSRNVTNVKPEVAEVCFVYNRGVILKGPEGAPTYASLFARIAGDWKYDWTDFRQACRRCRFEGPQVMRIDRVEE